MFISNQGSAEVSSKIGGAEGHTETIGGVEVGVEVEIAPILKNITEVVAIADTGSVIASVGSVELVSNKKPSAYHA